ncbi:hypothetical protein DL765_001234 [Monosporascus sp. GIB2]|nr:hypothetical protein DL765_001234 [Monosporascus sp. GIB2]
MSLPISLTDFFTLVKDCLGLGQRIQSLGDDHRHLQARAEVLSLVFGQLHEALLRFDNILKEFQAIFTDLRPSCYLSLCQIEPTLEQFEKLKTDNPGNSPWRPVLATVDESLDVVDIDQVQRRLRVRDPFPDTRHVWECPLPLMLTAVKGEQVIGLASRYHEPTHNLPTSPSTIAFSGSRWDWKSTVTSANQPRRRTGDLWVQSVRKRTAVLPL